VDDAKKKEIRDEAHVTTSAFIADHLTKIGCTDDGSIEADQTLHAAFTGVLSGVMWMMAGAYGSRPALTVMMTCMSDYVEHMMPLADAQHAKIEAAREEEKAAQQAELAAAQEAESGGHQP
jgi:hypothetical protein